MHIYKIIYKMNRDVYIKRIKSNVTLYDIFEQNFLLQIVQLSVQIRELVQE